MMTSEIKFFSYFIVYYLSKKIFFLKSYTYIHKINYVIKDFFYENYTIL